MLSPSTRLRRPALLVFMQCAIAALAAAISPVTNPSPANNATNLALNPSSASVPFLTWDAVPGATGYDVYFGTATLPAFQGRVTTNSYRLETLSRGTTYYWRVDSRDASTVGTGAEQHFSTTSSGTNAEFYKWPIDMTNSFTSLNSTSTAPWNYEMGLMLGEIYKLGQTLGGSQETTWNTFIRAWLDNSVNTTNGGQINNNTSNGMVLSQRELDDVGAAKLLLWIYTETGVAKYNNAATYVRESHINALPTTSDGGFWHKEVYDYQMWLDGLYMAQPFVCYYDQARGLTSGYDMAAFQLKLMAQHAKDPVTGLYYHGWHDAADPGADPPWADSVTGASPEFWGRADGWYCMALVDVLETLPTSHADYNNIVTLLQNLSAALLPYQDTDTGMWYQVLDKGNLNDNWVESSCTAMFAYAMLKGVKEGHLSAATYAPVARRALRGLMNNKVVIPSGNDIRLGGTVSVGTLNPSTSGAGTYNYYVTTSVTGTSSNVGDKKGYGAFLGAMRLLAEYDAAVVPVTLSGFKAE